MKSDNQTIRQSNNCRRAFTLIELLVVVGMIALITGAMSSSVAAAMQRARVQKATADVKMLTQAILAYENYNKGDLDPIPAWKDADFRTTLKFLNGENNGEVPVLIQAALSSGGIMRDPWGNPYQVKITQGSINPPRLGNLETGYYLPNFYRLSKEERQ